MKKFVFSLASVYAYKQTVEKTQKADLNKALAALLALQEEWRRVEAAFGENAHSLEVALKENMHVVDALKRHDDYFRYLKDRRDELELEIQKAQEEKDRRQAILIKTMKEVKTYTKLKEEQYRKYIEELQREEAKDIGDLISYKTVIAEKD